MRACSENRVLDKGNLNIQIKAGNDFDEFMNGGWKTKTKLPLSTYRYNVFTTINDSVNLKLENLLKSDPTNGLSLIFEKLKSSSSDISAMTNLIQLIDEINSPQSLAVVLAKLHKLGITALFYYDGERDVSNPRSIIPTLHPPLLRLGNPKYYDVGSAFVGDTNSINIINKYKEHIGNVLKLINPDVDVTTVSEQIYDIESTLTLLSNTTGWDTLVTITSSYAKVPLSTIYNMVPNFDWNTYWEEMDLLSYPEHMAKTIQGMISWDWFYSDIKWDTPETIEPLKNYLKFYTVDVLSEYLDLNSPFYNEWFNFYQTFMLGVQDKPTVANQTLAIMKPNLRFPLSQFYVTRSDSSKKRAKLNKIFNDVRQVMISRLFNVPWMSDQTKQYAITKLRMARLFIAYPDYWGNVSVPSVQGSRLDLIFEILKFNTNTIMNFGPLKPGQWFYNRLSPLNPLVPQTGAELKTNEVFVTEAFLSDDIFNLKFDDALNYSKFGFFVSGLLTLLIVGLGRYFKINGTVEDWWDTYSTTVFTSDVSDKIKNYFEGKEAAPNVVTDHERTLIANISDVGGIRIALEAFKLTDQYKQGKIIQNLSPMQRFFFGYGELFREIITPEFAEFYVKNSSLSTYKLRINGMLPHIDEWYKNFGVKDTDELYISQSGRIKVF